MVGMVSRFLLGIAFLGVIVLGSVKTSALSPPVFEKQPTWPEQSYYDEDGPPVVLNCEIVPDDSVRILWLKDGQPVSKDLKSWHISNKNQTLTLDPPERSQTGTYKCYIYNIAGNISYSNYLFIAGRTEVTRPRVVQTGPENQVIHATTGENVSLFCIFDVGGASTGLMDLEMNWKKNGTLVNDTIHTTWDVASTLENNQIFYLNITKLKVSDYGDYECVGSNSAGNDSRVLAVLPPQPNSGLDHAWIIVLGSVGGVFFIGTVVMVMMLYHRNCVRSKYKQFDWPETDLEHYDVPEVELKYDVFVSYSSEDQDWVLNSLFQIMTQNSYEVCIDFKDFTPGMAISENILDAIYKSRKVIVVLSHSFMKSMWGQFELSQALNRAVIQRKDVLILLKYDSCKVPVKLLGKTFLDWTNNDVRPHFWKRLFESVGEPGNYGNQSQQRGDEMNDDVNEGVVQKSSFKDLENANEGVIQNSSLKDPKDVNEGEIQSSSLKDPELDKNLEDPETTERPMNELDKGRQIICVNYDKEKILSSLQSESDKLIGNDSDIIDIHGSEMRV